MDPISKFLVAYKIPIGPWGKAFFGFLTDNFDTIFRAFSNGLNFILDGAVDLLLMVPPVLLALVVAIVAWLLQRSRPLAIGVFDRRDLEQGNGGWVWLDRRKTTRFRIGDHGLVAAAERDGKPAVWVSCADVERQPEEGAQVFWANPGTPLKTVMLAMHRSQTAPVALFDEGSRFVGAIGIRDVLSAVLRR